MSAKAKLAAATGYCPPAGTRARGGGNVNDAVHSQHSYLAG
jgi:hypothetical protein